MSGNWTTVVLEEITKLGPIFPHLVPKPWGLAFPHLWVSFLVLLEVLLFPGLWEVHITNPIPCHRRSRISHKNNDIFDYKKMPCYTYQYPIILCDLLNWVMVPSTTALYPLLQLSLGDFRTIVAQCNMMQGSENVEMGVKYWKAREIHWY